MMQPDTDKPQPPSTYGYPQQPPNGAAPPLQQQQQPTLYGSQQQQPQFVPQQFGQQPYGYQQPQAQMYPPPMQQQQQSSVHYGQQMLPGQPPVQQNTASTAVMINGNQQLQPPVQQQAPQPPMEAEKPEEVEDTPTTCSMTRSRSMTIKVCLIVLVVVIVLAAVVHTVWSGTVYNLIGAGVVALGVGFYMTKTPGHVVVVDKVAHTITITRTNLIGSWQCFGGYHHIVNIADVSGVYIKQVWSSADESGSNAHAQSSVMLQTRTFGDIEIMATQTGRPGRNGVCGGDPLEYAEQHMHFWANVLNANGGAVLIFADRREG